MTEEEREEIVARQARLENLSKHLTDAELEAMAVENKDILSLATLELVRQVESLDKHLTIQELQSHRIADQARRTRRIGNANSVLLFVTIAAIIVMGFLIAQNRKLAGNQRSIISCVKDWADQTSQNDSILRELKKPLEDATDQVFRSVNKPNFEQAFNEALANYFKASDAYHEALIKHPVPPSPDFLCK